MNRQQHIPVLLDEVLSFFENHSLKVVVDGTLGAGGHSLALLEHHPEIELLVGFDQDRSALQIAAKRLECFKEKVVFIEKNFCEMKKVMEKQKINKVDGILLDIGVSSMQLDQAERGFSFSKEGPLDMRMDQNCTLTAAEIVNTWPEKELADLFYNYGDLTNSRLIARKIVEARLKKRFETTKDLGAILEPFLKAPYKKKIHPLTLVFQALRIAVNNELKVLNYSLPIAIDLLSPYGRLGVISFHSGEDRIVKNYFKAIQDKVVLLTKKPICAGETEIQKNPRSRSAKLRFIERKAKGVACAG